MADEQVAEPDSTAVRVALWRALHLRADAPPHVLEDEIGLRLAGPPDGWQDRPDMDPVFTAGFRASIVARARFIEDLVAERAAQGTGQYVLLGAGLDTFAQRRPGLAARLRVFEVDQPGTQAWKRRRLTELGYGIPDWLRFVPVDFETGASWRAAAEKAGFDAAGPAVVASAGVSLYLTREANEAALRDLAALAPGSTVAMTFMLPLDLVDEPDRQGWIMSEQGARSSGTPFVSFFSPDEFLDLARSAGFKEVRHVSGRDLNDRYLAGRPDGLRASTGEDFLIAAT
ncbi:MAG TPA: class I SAM-dependent methyltransferase [Trebonia sp.]|nr:class I SAM-dependent methyltransferase [Trebonia sp.]